MFSWSFRELWASRANRYLRDDLDQAEASIQTVWNQEHTPSGGHAHVTADTIVSGAVTTDELASGPGQFSGHVTPAADNLYDLGRPGQRWNRLYSSSMYYLTGGGIASALLLGATAKLRVAGVDELVVDQGLVNTPSRLQAPFITLLDGANTWSLYVSSGKLYIVSGTTASGGTVVGTQT
jgi:hypothetical protein